MTDDRPDDGHLELELETIYIFLKEKRLQKWKLQWGLCVP